LTLEFPEACKAVATSDSPTVPRTRRLLNKGQSLFISRMVESQAFSRT
jgi:hypothetical protein